MTTRADLVAPKPRDWTFEEAAAMPIAFVTAGYAPAHLAKLRAGERVLIHAAAGGVGLAAVQLARAPAPRSSPPRAAAAKRGLLARARRRAT